MAGHVEAYRIRPARPTEIGRLRDIEDGAGAMFEGLGLIDESLDVAFPRDDLRRLIDAGQVWVAVDATDRPVGAVIASVRDHAVYVEEMDVLPEHGRRGLGSRLLARVGEWAQERGYPAVTLSTFRDVPWNGPFYRTRGFRDLSQHEWSPGMPAIRAAEARHGLRVDARVFMRRDLARTTIQHDGKRPTMPTDRTPLFCDTALAARIERAEVDLLSASNGAARRRRNTTGFLIPLAGGVASFADDGSPYNKVAGLGFDGMPDADELDEIERAFAERGAQTQIELAHLADPSIAAMLTARGYRLESFENVLGRALDGDPGLPTPPDIVVRRSPDDEFDAWLKVVADGATQPDTQGLPWHEEFPREVYERAERDAAGAGVLRYAALRHGELAGGAGLRITDGIAQFAGAATTPAHRRHGVQTALLGTRLADAATAGCDIGVIITQPGSMSQQNSQRQGFDLLYTRAVLVK